MTRFWTRILQPFQKKKKLPVIPFNEYANPSTYLKESCMYINHLVRIDKLEKAYNSLLQQQQRKFLPSMTYWKMMEPFVQIWYGEMERICRQSQVALILLNTQLSDLSHTLCSVSSPLKNRDRQTLTKAHKFITNCIKEWDLNPIREIVVASPTEVKCSKSMYSSNPALLFLETTLELKTNSESRDSQFQAYYQELEDRLQQELGCNKNNLRLRQCMRQVYRLEQEIYLYYRYISSQFSILWDLGSRSLGDASLLPPDNNDPSLYQVMKTKWQERYNQQIWPYHELEASFKTVLKSSAPNSQDFSCAICLSILHEPVTLSSCHHTYCRSCVQQLYCRHCHRHRTKRVNRISEKLSLLKPLPPVYCTCLKIDSTTGEPVSNHREGSCPLCRTTFKAEHCTTDVALARFISLYFPKRKHDEEEEEREIADFEERRKKRKESEGVGRRRSQVSATNFYFKMQRWSHILSDSVHPISPTTCPDQIGDDNEIIPPVPPLPSYAQQQQIHNDVYFLTRRSWMF